MIGIRHGIRLGISINRNPEAMAGHPTGLIDPRIFVEKKQEWPKFFEKEKREKFSPDSRSNPGALMC